MALRYADSFPKRSKQILVYLAGNASIAAIYFLMAKVGLSLAFAHQSITPVWPPAGIALASLLLFGPRFWPGIFAGALLANYYLTNVAPLAATGIAIGNTLEAAAGMYLFRAWRKRRLRFDRPVHVIKFAVFPAALATTVSATLGTLTLSVLGAARWGDYGHLWFTWWLGDFSGVLVLAPLLLSIDTEFRQYWTARKAFAALPLFLSVALLSAFLFDVPAQSNSAVYLVLPFLIWAALRFDQFAVSLVTILFSAVAISFTARGHGPFARESLNASLLSLQLFMTVITLTAHTLMSAVRQITKSEQNLKRLVSQLTQSNTELEQFTQIASHDLQEPLRMVSTYMSLATRQTQRPTPPSEGAPDYTELAMNAVKRMQRLIQDLLKFTQLDRQSIPLQKVGVSDLISEVCSDLRLLIQETGATVHAELLCDVSGDRVQLHQLFQNLIANAIKFRSSHSPVVEISATESMDGRCSFSVRDNGIGFPMEEAEQIFGFFYRLHGQSKYPGSGLGLAVCKKIVERHGGIIRAESQTGTGSTFYFTLPSAAALTSAFPIPFAKPSLRESPR